jgi:hypothetical protein
MKLGTWHFRIGINRRGNYRPRWFWMTLFVILVIELIYNLVGVIIASPLNALMIVLLTPMIFFIWTRLWYMIELRSGSVANRAEFRNTMQSRESPGSEQPAENEPERQFDPPNGHFSSRPPESDLPPPDVHQS